MKLSAFILFISVSFFACVANENPSRDEVEAKLRTAMQDHLYSSVNNDSSKVQYRVENVVFYDDAKANVYICDFTVHMKVKSATRLVDTTGNMRATISKDFKTVKRSS